MKKIGIICFIFLAGCAAGSRGSTGNWCLETACINLENSGEHYQEQQLVPRQH